jgi:hypothetical protein
VTGEGSPVDEQRLLRAIANLSRFHRDHERFYASSPRAEAVTLQRHARTLLALAGRWSTVVPDHPEPFSPFEGADDLNDPAALQLDGGASHRSICSPQPSSSPTRPTC